jgi:hypothetical protein
MELNCDSAEHENNVPYSISFCIAIIEVLRMFKVL